jgi:hypothetical protein
LTKWWKVQATQFYLLESNIIELHFLQHNTCAHTEWHENKRTWTFNAYPNLKFFLYENKKHKMWQHNRNKSSNQATFSLFLLPYNTLVGARDGRTQSARACLFFFPSPQTHPPKNLKIWSLIPSDTMKSPGFFKPRGIHKGPKQAFYFYFKKNCDENLLKSLQWWWSELLLLLLLLCVFCFYFVFIFTFIFLFI